MDDTPTYSLTGKDRSGAKGSLTLFCVGSRKGLFFKTDQFLGSEKSGTIEVRFDDGSPFYAASFLDNESAMLSYPNPNGAQDKQMQAQNAEEMMQRLGAGKQKRLRVRIPTYDGRSTDLDFDVEELGSRLSPMLARCS